MKKLRGNSAFTIIEVIVSIAIFAAIALPLFSVFVQSIKTDVKASDVLNANYIAQDYIEKLDSVTYSQALQNKPNKAVKGDYTLSADILPYGTAAKSFFGGPCGYAQLIISAGGSMLAVMPDGKWYVFGSVPSPITFSISGGTYTFKGGSSKTITGSISWGYCAVLINAVNNASTASVTVGANCKAAYYCKDANAGNITINGANETYKNTSDGNTSLIYVKASVYDSSGAVAAFSESYTDIKNW
jgi:prepilin-type N-terminal cleavage/methylation domain-containing protein